jgi:uncharacterized membrane protein YbhN (UPF0104 family)
VRVGERCTLLLPGSWRAHAVHFLHSVAEAMGFLKSWRSVALALLCSAGVWLAQGLSTYALTRGLGMEIGLAGSFFVVIVTAVAVAAPQGPGYLGIFQVAVVKACEVFQAAPSESGALALLMWLVNIIPITLVGLGFLWYEGLSLRKLVSASRELRAQDSPQRTQRRS